MAAITPIAEPAPVAAGQNGEETTMKKALKYIMIFMASQSLISILSSQFGKTASKFVPDAQTDTQTSTAVPTGPTTPETRYPPIWPSGTVFSMLIYTSVDEDPAIDFETQAPLAVFNNITYGDWKAHREAEVLVDLPVSVQNNGSFYGHIYLVDEDFVEGSELAKPRFTPDHIVRHTKQLARYYEPTKVKKAKKLIGSKSSSNSVAGKEEEQEEEKVDGVVGAGPRIVSHWATNLTLTIITDIGPAQNNPILEPYMVISSDNRYYPIIYPNDFWLLKDSQFPINNTTPQVPLKVTYDPISFMKFNLYASMTSNWEKEQANPNPNPLAGPGIDPDEIKKLLLSANPYWAAATAILSVLHMLFEFLAFKSDVGHWRKTDKNLVGVSLRSIITNVVTQVIILLYLLDSGEQTSKMILLTNGMGILVEVWKITKVINFKYHPPAPGQTFPSFTFEDKKELSEDEKRTREYDALAFRIVGAVAVPVLMAYAAYSLQTHEYKGWYSFIVTTLAEAVYMFGFAQLVPQLIINYKLKSVAHLPMKAFFYKTLTTVIDDFGSMIIPMPWLHRLACFRDDAVFVVLLYQRWIYRVDYSRANEYGQVMEVPDMDPHEGTAGKVVADVPGVKKSEVEGKTGQVQKGKKGNKKTQ